MTFDWMSPLVGGVIIGLAVSLMLLLNGRVTGISGILYGLVSPQKGESPWRLFFVGGLILGGLSLKLLNYWPQAELNLEMNPVKVMIAGGVVGFGTVLGSGCTSGHGVCGISRLSVRSLVATLVFIAAGVISVSLFSEALI